MWNEPSKKKLAKIPKIYETSYVALEDKLVYLHFFIGGCDWYIVEYDGEDLMFGYAILNGDIENGEWGYVSFNELKEVRINLMEVDCDLHWKIVPAGKVPLVRCW